jgi:hypothetical protein
VPEHLSGEEKGMQLYLQKELRVPFLFASLLVPTFQRTVVHLSFLADRPTFWAAGGVSRQKPAMAPSSMTFPSRSRSVLLLL